MASPVAYVFIRSFADDTDRWATLLDDQIPSLMANTLSLTVIVVLFAVIVGVSLAWLVGRTDLPGHRIWRWLLAVPLAMPPYVGAMSYVIILGPRGLVADIAGSTPVDVYSLGGAAFVLSIFTYPYVFLIVGAALTRLGRAPEEAARTLGASPLSVLTRVTVPMLRPAIGAGAVLVALYALSDFGAIALLRFPTFTSAIYYQMGGYDTISAAVLSTVLIALTILVLIFEAFTRRRSRFYQSSGVATTPPRTQLGRARIPALAFVSFVFAISTLVPVAVLVHWAYLVLASGELDPRFMEHATNTVMVAGLAALASAIFAMPVVYLRSRHHSAPSGIIERLAYSGYALPGVIVALGVIFFALRVTPIIYNTMFVIAFAYVLRFLPQAMQSISANMAHISPRIDEAARIAGLSPTKVLTRVISPLVGPGIMSGAALVLVSSIKELPATLMLRPAGFDTLAVRVWVEAGEGLYHLAAPAALVIVVLSMLPLKLMLGRYEEIR